MFENLKNLERLEKQEQLKKQDKQKGLTMTYDEVGKVANGSLV